MRPQMAASGVLALDKWYKIRGMGQTASSFSPCGVFFLHFMCFLPNDFDAPMPSSLWLILSIRFGFHFLFTLLDVMEDFLI
jgi:hypothetical protein